MKCNILSQKYILIVIMIISVFWLSSCSSSSDSGIFDFSSEQKKLDADSIAKKESVNLKGGNILSFGQINDKLSETIQESSIFYYGELKNGSPHGQGILYGSQLDTSTNTYYLIIGNFVNGKTDGYCTVYEIIDGNFYTDDIMFLYKIYEGYFKDGELDGKGSKFYLNHGPDLNEALWWGNDNSEGLTDSKDLWQDFCINTDTLLWNHQFIDLTPLLYDDFNQSVWTGEYKNGELNGNGIQYSFARDIVYEGNFTNDRYNGKGSLYGTATNQSEPYDSMVFLKYEGEFKDGKYHGKGTLYNPDGSVKRDGKWKDGDTAN